MKYKSHVWPLVTDFLGIFVSIGIWRIYKQPLWGLVALVFFIGVFVPVAYAVREARKEMVKYEPYRKLIRHKDKEN